MYVVINIGEDYNSKNYSIINAVYGPFENENAAWNFCVLQKNLDVFQVKELINVHAYPFNERKDADSVVVES